MTLLGTRRPISPLIERRPLVVLAIVLENRHFVSEETCCLCSRMRDQGLSFREFELEGVVQKLSDSQFNLLGFTSWPDEAQKKIVSIPDVA